MLRLLAIILGIIFMIFGVLGFMPEFYSDGKFLGLFANSSINNIFHLGVGTVGLMSGVRGGTAPFYFFIGAGVVYGIVAILGFYDSSMMFFKFLATSSFNNWLYAGIAALSLYLAISLRAK